MNKNKELVKNTIIIFIGKFCTQFITLLLLPLYTHFLSTEDYGYIDLIQTYLTFFIPLILLKIDAGIFRFLIDARKSEEENYNKWYIYNVCRTYNINYIICGCSKDIFDKV